MKYEFIPTEQMKEDRFICDKDGNICEECSCRIGENDCIFNYCKFNYLYVTAELPKEQLLEKLEAVETIKSLMSGCTPDSKYYKVGKMAINALSAIETIHKIVDGDLDTIIAVLKGEQEPKYCDRNICIKNEYNGIGCDECEVTKSQEPSVEILKTEESDDNGTKYLNINVSDGEVKRNPDVVRLCSDVGILEYVRKEQK